MCAHQGGGHCLSIENIASELAGKRAGIDQGRLALSVRRVVLLDDDGTIVISVGSIVVNESYARTTGLSRQLNG
jgi:hypothetical protein